MVQRNGSAGLTKVSKSSDNGIVCVMWPGRENFNNHDVEVNYSEKQDFINFYYYITQTMHETICINKKSLSLQDGGTICVSEIA